MSVESPLTTDGAEAAAVAESPVVDPEIVTTSVNKKSTAKSGRKPIAHPIPTRFRDRFPNGLNYTNFTWMLVMHTGAVASLFYFSWTGLAICAVLHFGTLKLPCVSKR